MYYASIEKYGIGNANPSDAKKKEDAEKKKNLFKYTKQAEWRTVHRKLRSFLRCADYLIMELLKRVVTLAVADIFSQIEAAVNMKKKPTPRTVNWLESKRNANKRGGGLFFEVEPKIVASVLELNLQLEDGRKSAKGRSARFQSRPYKFHVISFHLVMV